MESLAKQDRDINEDFNFWALVPSVKDSYLKFCKVFETRLRVVLADYRVIPDDEEQATTAKVKGVIQNWSTRKAMSKQQLSDLTLELQFLDAHKKQYASLAADFASISFSPKSKTALENFKELILLDLKILFKWVPISLGNIPENNLLLRRFHKTLMMTGAHLAATNSVRLPLQLLVDRLRIRPRFRIRRTS